MCKFTFIFVLIAFGFIGSSQAEERTLAGTGLSLLMPEGWHENTPEEWRRNLDRIRLGDASMEDFLAQNAEAPLLQLMRYEEPYPELNPSFTIKLRAGRVADPGKLVQAIIPTLRGLFDEFEIEAGPTSALVGGLVSSTVSFTYVLRTEENAVGVPVHSQMWITPAKDRFFIIGAGAPNPVPADVQRIIAETIASIQIE